MNNSAFTLTIDDNKLAWLQIDVPNEKMNTLQDCFATEISQVLEQLEATSDIKGMVIYSGKPDNFVAGADIKMLAACETAEQAQQLAATGQELFTRLENLPFHVVAAIHGPCLGGGLELALACHSRVATLDDKTRIGLPEVQLGLLPGSGGTQRLPRLIGVANALDMILTGKQLRAKKAKKMGVVDAVVDSEILLTVAKEIALEHKPKRQSSWQNWAMGGNPLGRSVVFDQAKKKTEQKTRGNYPATTAILEVIKHGLDKSLSQGYALEAQRFGELVMSSQSKALRHIFFATTAMKKEQGSLEQAQSLTHIGVLGGGLMGAGISHVTATKAGLPVRIKDVHNDGVLNALNYNYKLLSKKRDRKIISKAQLQKQMSMLTGGTNFIGFNQLDMVVEAVFEDLALKHQMVRDIETHSKPDTIFATNTSSLPIHQIASAAQRPEQVVGLHYFSPVEKMPLVEIIPHQGTELGGATSQQTIETAITLAKKQGKTPIVVADTAGFYVNRILAPYMNEAARLLLEGEPIEHIDRSLLDFGFPVGPITLLDEVGVDIGAKISPILLAELGERFQAPDLFDTLLNDGRKGRKSGKGFYLYNGKKKEVDKQVYQLLNLEPEQHLAGQDLALRCTLMMLNEAVRCLDEGVIQSARDGDIGAIFGIGFPPFLGGPFHYMDSLGLDRVLEMFIDYSHKYGERFAPCEGIVMRAENKQSFY
ncbi:fatty acid oxidation complex subunit alpha FadJ [Photobacterium damselae subsp. damselae]|uniref:fatty acid oxidation complex subunit alpha FadJ n=1 Tax=Photobacterium damselae TaxID=38293 RepID=UPI001EEDC1BB|nr:fatty acid oxidation complex subunit alpha FadJ [Photobacterium damselae]UJZ93168.1 fatty acid oxidation complex subunit alpha FadJ [Photobacterium damselae subsp. damselae]UJZ97151.1 fatty acid oxidation complex subunit alpha FadJ [Photobacterium damselae subsp. damselae]